MNAESLRDRLPALESAVRLLKREEINLFADVVRQSTASGHVWPPDRRFVFDGAADLKVSAEEQAVVRELWTRMNAGLVYAVTGQEVNSSIDRLGFLARLDKIGPLRQQIEGRAATVLERELGGHVWLATIGIWNALCASLFRETLNSSLRDDLAAAWRSVSPSQAVLPEPTR